MDRRGILEIEKKRINKKTLGKKMLKGIIYIFIGMGLIFAYVKYIERQGIFFPLKNIETTPSLLHIPFEDVYFRTEDNIGINAWFIPQEGAKYTILFCHGNAGNIGNRLEKIVLLRGADVNIFIIDYRGYGRSQGKPSEEGLYLDARAAYDYLVDERKVEAENIILYGESIGAAVIINLASEVKVAGLIAEGAFSAGRDMARQIYPFLPSFIFSNKFDSLSKIKDINEPKLFIHSQDDEIIPFGLAKKLFNAAREPKQLKEMKGSHNTSFLDCQEAYVSYIKSFIRQL